MKEIGALVRRHLSLGQLSIAVSSLSWIWPAFCQSAPPKAHRNPELNSPPLTASTAFWFVHTSGIAYEKNVFDHADQFLDFEYKAQPKPAFIVDTNTFGQGGGDAIPTGNQGIYYTPFDDELAASPKDAHSKCASFDQGGCHFILADPTIYLQYGGRFKQGQLTWLETDLQKVPRETPVFLFFNDRGPIPQHDVDGRFLHLLASHNVKAMYIGTTLRSAHWTINGIHCFATSDLHSNSLDLIEVTPQTIRFILVDKGKRRVIATVPRRAGHRCEVECKLSGTPVQGKEQRRIQVQLLSEGHIVKEPGIKARYRLDKEAIQELHDQANSTFKGIVSTANLTNGMHRLYVEVQLPTGERYQHNEFFLAEPNRDQPKLAWVAVTGDAIRANPTLEGNTLYVNSFDGTTYALNAETGQLIWKAPLNEAMLTSPVVAGKKVYVNTLAGNLYCLSANSGNRLWVSKGLEKIGSFAVCGNIVCYAQNNFNNVVVGLDAETGAQVWTKKLDTFVVSEMTADQTKIYFSGRNSARFALDYRDGGVRFRESDRYMNLDWPVQSMLNIGGEHLFYTVSEPEYGLLVACSSRDGKEQWTIKPVGWKSRGMGEAFTSLYSRPVYFDGVVYIGANSKDGDYYALVPETGKIMWRMPSRLGYYNHTAALTCRYLLASEARGKMVWMDRLTGKILKQYRLGPGALSEPTVSETCAYFTSYDGSVYAVRLPVAK